MTNPSKEIIIEAAFKKAIDDNRTELMVRWRFLRAALEQIQENPVMVANALSLMSYEFRRIVVSVKIPNITLEYAEDDFMMAAEYFFAKVDAGEKLAENSPIITECAALQNAFSDFTSDSSALAFFG